MDYNEIISFVKEIELFQGLNDREFQILSESIEESTFRRGELLFEENGERKDLFLIYDGEVELFKKNVYGEEKRLSFFTRGDFLGEGSWSSDSKHSTSARAVVDTHVLSVKKEYFVENSESALKVLSNVAQVISRRMRHANNRMVNVAAQYEAGETRQEHDLLGYRDVPNQAYYGIQTMRAIENFNISGVTLNFYPVLVESLAMVKKAAARANHDLGLLDDRVADAITTACTEIANGRYQYHFVVDMIQGGAGTSTNMNANEVIANRALEIMGRKKGEYEYCHPNNHVNLSQSTNDAYPTAIKIALYNNNINLIETLKKLIGSFMRKGEEFEDVLKMGRTQLQDAVPMTLGQNFMAWAVTLEEEVQRLEENVRLFLEINMGATAIGTGINSDPDYADKVVKHLRDITGLDLKNAENLVEATQDTGAFVMYSSAIKRLAVKLSKISNDLRLLSSGPRTGLNEINLPPMQPGSSIMPGKVNPVIPEVVNQIAFKVIGNDLTVTIAAEAGQLELNVMEPVIVQSIFESVEMLKNGMMTLKHRCIDDIKANRERCLGMVQNSISIVTALNPVLGYETCSALAKEALETDGSVYDLCIKKGLLSKEELDKILSPERMIRPQKMK
ncbi:MAG TPA: aspartate ammonia-lyase [Bacteroidales bacterium]|nr:aspartate ammonia-lyase [Bacteroidales bacterium]